MLKYICILLLFISETLSRDPFPVGDNVSCDREDERKIYINNYEMNCNKGYRCNLNFKENGHYCVQDEICFGNFVCITDKLVSVYEESELDCGSNKVCNENATWPCEPCLVEACLRTTYKCDPSDEKMVHILEPTSTTMFCPANKVCNKNNVYPCEWCITATGVQPTTPSPTATTTPKIDVDCNDGYGTKNPCRRGNKVNTSVYYRCKSVWYWYEYDVVSCANLKTDSVCKDKVYWCA